MIEHVSSMPCLLCGSFGSSIHLRATSEQSASYSGMETIFIDQVVFLGVMRQPSPPAGLQHIAIHREAQLVVGISSAVAVHELSPAAKVN